MKSNLKKFLILTSLVMTMKALAQDSRSSDVGISMGLIPVYEISEASGCPQVLAAPSIQWFQYEYRQCDTDSFIRYQKRNDVTEARLNQKLRDLCMENLMERNGCRVELKVIDEHDYSRPVFNNDLGEEE